LLIPLTPIITFENVFLGRAFGPTTPKKC
jgi:hypothetical protein